MRRGRAESIRGCRLSPSETMQSRLGSRRTQASQNREQRSNKTHLKLDATLPPGCGGANAFPSLSTAQPALTRTFPVVRGTRAGPASPSLGGNSTSWPARNGQSRFNSAICARLRGFSASKMWSDNQLCWCPVQLPIAKTSGKLGPNDIAKMLGIA